MNQQHPNLTHRQDCLSENIKTERGFTLIELVVVVVILAILSAFALPRFANFSSQARAASIQAMAGTLESAASLVYMRALLEGAQNSPATSIEVNGQNINIVYGYPQSTLLNGGFLSQFSAWLSILADRDVNNAIQSDWLLTDDADTPGISLGIANSGPGIGIVLADFSEATGGTTNISRCGISYFQPAAAGEKPLIEVFVDEC